jgi:hypothetical protein
MPCLVFVVLFSVTSHWNPAVCWFKELLATICHSFGYGQDTEAVRQETILRQSRIPIPSLFSNHTQKTPLLAPTVSRRRFRSKSRTHNKHTNNNTKTQKIDFLVLRTKTISS